MQPHQMSGAQQTTNNSELFRMFRRHALGCAAFCFGPHGVRYVRRSGSTKAESVLAILSERTACPQVDGCFFPKADRIARMGSGGRASTRVRITNSELYILERLARIVCAEDLREADEEALFVVVCVNEPAGDVVGFGILDLARLRL